MKLTGFYMALSGFYMIGTLVLNGLNYFESCNLFHITDVFPYPQKTSEKQRFSDVFREYRERPVTQNESIHEFTREL